MAHLSFRQRSKKILNIALPAGLNSLLDITNVVLGIFMVSRLSSAHIAALGLGLNFVMLIFVVTNIFFVGTNAQISRLYGKKAYGDIALVLSSMFFGALLFSLPLFFVAHALYVPYFAWIGADNAAAKLGETFVGIVIFGVPALLGKTILVSAFSAIGNTKTPFLIKIFTTISNLALTYALVFGVFFAPLDIAGVGIANVATTYLELFILLFLALKKGAKGANLTTKPAANLGANPAANLLQDSANPPVESARQKQPKIIALKPYFSLNILKKGLGIGLPVGAERAFTLMSLVLVSKFVAHFGGDYLAGLQIATRIEAFAVMPSFGFMVASMALTGQYLGQGRVDLLKNYIHTTIILASIFMGVMGAAMMIFSEPLSLLFSSEPAVVHSSALYLVCVGISQIPLVFIFVLDGAYRGAGATKVSLGINALSIWLLRIPPMWLSLRLGCGLLALYLIILGETCIRSAIFFYVFKRHFGRIFV